MSREDLKTNGEANIEGHSAAIDAKPSDARVVALQERGEKEIVTSDKRKLLVRIIQSKCMGAESCVTVAPTVFSLDPNQLGLFRRGREPLGLRSVVEGSANTETVVLAAMSCPFKAIYVRDVNSGEELVGEPW